MADLTSKRYLGEEGIKQIGKNIKGGNELSGSTGYTVTDSVEYPLVGLKVFGKSTQDGTPTPENPVEIVSVENPTMIIEDGAKGEKGNLYTDAQYRFLFDSFDVWKDTSNYKVIAETNQNKEWNWVAYINTNNIYNNTYETFLCRRGGEIVNSVYVTPTTLEGYVILNSMEISASNTLNIPHPISSLTFPDTLNAIPVSTGGNVTIDGQEYIADYVDFERGVKVQRVKKIVFDGSTYGVAEYVPDKPILIVKLPDSNSYQTSQTATMCCDRLTVTSASKIYNGNVGIGINDTKLWLNIDNTISTVNAANSWLANNPITVIYQLATPIETPISESELQAYRQLQTYNGTTNISNDKGAGLSVQYCTSKMLAEYALPLIKDLEAENAKKDEEISALKTDILTNEKIHNRIYEGINLAEKFASEIAAAPYNGNPWAWIKARITAEDFTGIHVGDYIPFTTTNGVTLNAQIAGINTYKNYGDTPVGSHIDFICKELWGTTRPVNKVDYNNGTESQPHPWLASDLYLYLNSLSGSVPNSATVNPETVDVDYTEDGVYYYLPDALKNVIIEKRFLLPTRYSASGLLTNDNAWGWSNIGKLWLPDEYEVYGAPIWSGKGFSVSGSGLQYPLFAGNMNRPKFRDGRRSNWWLLSLYSGDSSRWCFVSDRGVCNTNKASYGSTATPVCFRV